MHVITRLGCLSLPQVLDLAGIYLGITLIVMTGFVSLMSMNTVAKAAERLKTGDFIESLRVAMGEWWAKSVAVLYVMFSIGTILFYECSD